MQNMRIPSRIILLSIVCLTLPIGSTFTSFASEEQDSGFEVPKFLHKENPSYPELAERAGLQAWLVVEVLVSSLGKVFDARIGKPTGTNAGFEEAAIEAARKCTFASQSDTTSLNIAWISFPYEFNRDGIKRNTDTIPKIIEIIQAGHPEFPFEVLLEAAERGYSDAQNFIGLRYLRASPSGLRAADDTKAIAWFLKAVEQGSAAAQNSLGFMYSEGRGVSQDYAEAVVWFRKAAEQGIDIAQSNLGYMYANGMGVSQDYAEARIWLKKAVEQGFVDAQNTLDAIELDLIPAAEVNSFELAKRKYKPKDMGGLILGKDGVFSGFFQIVQRLELGVYLVSIPNDVRYSFYCLIPSYVNLEGLVTGSIINAVVEASGEYDYVTTSGQMKSVKKLEVLYGEKAFVR